MDGTMCPAEGPIHPEAEIDATGGTLSLDPTVAVRRHAAIETGPGGRIRIGRKSVIFQYAQLLAHGGEITIGEFCTVNPFCVLYGHGGLHIGNYVRIATHTVMIPANHVFDDPDAPITRQGLRMQGITIEDDVWIGAGARVLDGITIGRGAVVAAGAVVNRDVPPLAIFGGVPARQLGWRGGARDRAPDAVTEAGTPHA
jgi:acetyltransferase-like isoleucine patch superfamily enzyme